jgi:hypothetical protein
VLLGGGAVEEIDQAPAQILDVALERTKGKKREKIAPDSADGLFHGFGGWRRLQGAQVASVIKMTEFEGGEYRRESAGHELCLSFHLGPAAHPPDAQPPGHRRKRRQHRRAKPGNPGQCRVERAGAQAPTRPDWPRVATASAMAQACASSGEGLSVDLR